ncbi:MAG: hypothetical protein IJ775_05785 [Muribaculaceae bacterium]|nr:hypothetical protein [Muribaculaceae bacterium]
MKRLLHIAILLLAGALSMLAQEIDFINNEVNHIIMNGDDWGDMRRSLKNSKSWTGGKWQVVQIGDSHIQPGIMTAQVRWKMQDKWGNGGRGLIAALNLARTNEPRDYYLKSSDRVKESSRLLSRTWTTEIGLTGVAVRWDSAFTQLSIRAKEEGDEFSSVTLLHAPHGGYETAMVDGNVLVAKSLSPWASRVDLKHAVDTVTLGVPCKSDFYGAIITNGKTGVMAHSIGNNGATYGTYLKVPDFAEQMKVLNPHLIIISLGTNEAFGNLSGVEDNIHRLVTSLRKAMPGAHILLTTPMECQRKTSRQVAQQVKVGGGKRRKARYKTVYKTVTGFAANSNITRVRDIIMTYGRNHKIPVWDLYTVAGGYGASGKWVSAGLMNPSDHLHQLEAGYELQGMLLADALMKELTK